MVKWSKVQLIRSFDLLRRLGNARYSTRHGHALAVWLPNSSLEAVASSSLNTAKKLWNALPPEFWPLDIQHCSKAPSEDRLPMMNWPGTPSREELKKFL
uniref:Uncharacterized protein n=1 Tax=Acrobeloides nanus TaxID=290746 RepID=A0A914E194_9BILA